MVVKRLALSLAAAMALSAMLAGPGNVAEASAPAHAKPAKHLTAKLTIRRVSAPLYWYDVSPVQAGDWHKVALISFKVTGCEPGAYLYWSPGPAYQDGQQATEVFGGLGQGEDYCKDDGTSTYGTLFYRVPRNLHRGWATVTAEVDQYDNATVLATSTRRVWIAGAHR